MNFETSINFGRCLIKRTATNPIKVLTTNLFTISKNPSLGA